MNGGFVSKYALIVAVLILALVSGATLWIDSRSAPPNPAELAAWDRARGLDTPAAYSRFLSQWGGSVHEQAASLRLAELEAEQEQRRLQLIEEQRELIVAVQRGLSRLGFSLQASGELDAATERTLRDWLGVDEGSPLRIDEALVGRIENAFLAREPDAWAETVSLATTDAYRSFINSYPDSRFVESAESAIAALEADQQRRTLIRAIQQQLQRLGQAVDVTGVLDGPTAGLLRELASLQAGDEQLSVDADLLAELEARERWPLRAGDRFRDCRQCPEMVVVPGGTFLMGSPAAEYGRQDNEGPRREVTVRMFAIGASEVSFDDWQACVDQGGCAFVPADQGWGRGARPVINVSLEDAQAYARWLSATTDEWYRLPSEAEWEYAARAGSQTSFPSGPCLADWQANFDASRSFGACPTGDSIGQTAPVASYPPNAFGLHDLHGNVREWVADCWNPDYRGAPVDGSPWMNGDCGRAVLRGGAWSDPAILVRSASRTRPSGAFHNDRTGFRVVREVRRETGR
jgi:serine/threonine-protein kinase